MNTTRIQGSREILFLPISKSWCKPCFGKSSEVSIQPGVLFLGSQKVKNEYHPLTANTSVPSQERLHLYMRMDYPSDHSGAENRQQLLVMEVLDAKVHVIFLQDKITNRWSEAVQW
jgi:hypothetical protein